MPFVNVRTARGLLDPDRKARLHQEITDLMVRIEGRGDPGFRRYVLVLIEEHPAESWCAGGHGMTGEDVAALARGGADS